MECISFLELCFGVIFDFIYDLLSGTGFFPLVIFTYVVYTCIVCPFWSFLHVPDDHKMNRLRGDK